jgi:UDP-3-O-[3-hydroxymyristoyl] glucosamine N-acyltransferase
VAVKLTVAELAELVGGKVVGDPDRMIEGVGKIETARPSEVTFLANPRYTPYLSRSKAGAVLVPPGTKVVGPTLVEVKNPYLAFLTLLERFSPKETWTETGVHPTAVLEEGVELGPEVAIGAFCFIGRATQIGARTVLFPHVVVGPECRIGDDCRIYPRTTLRERVRIGNRVVIQPGAVIGADGFGFVPDTGEYRKIPQIGTVVIEDDVEIGANTTIDRATMEETRVGAGTKLDNLIQVAHNVVIGKNCVIAAQTGISGSTRIGRDVRVAGQVGFVGHISVGDGAQVGAKSGVGRNIPSGGVFSGHYARPHSLWRRIEACMARLPDLFRRVRALESRQKEAVTSSEKKE